VTIEALNALPPEAFAEALRPLFEAAPPLAEALAARRPFRSYAELLQRAEQVLEDLPEAQKVAVIDAHPRLGESASALRQQSALSYREQGYDRPGAQDDDAVLRELAALNRAYEQRFGFRFVVFVNRRSKADSLPVLRERLTRPRAEEMETALQEMLAIARDRLRTLQEAAEGT
jgi:OHCU decarboxylase